MNINIKATGIELTPAISDYVHKKVSSLEKYISNSDVVAQVEVGKSTNHHKAGDIYRAEIHLIGGGIDHYAVEETHDLYAAIDKVKDEVAHELTHTKGKKFAMVRRGQRMMKNAMKGFPWGLKRFKFRKGDE